MLIVAVLLLAATRPDTFRMDAMVGKDLERGLANLKRIAEQG